MRRTFFFIAAIAVFGLISTGIIDVHAQAVVGSALNELKPVTVAAGVEDTTIETTVGDVVQVLLSISGMFFLALMIYAGIRWMTARGDEAQIEASRKTITAAVIGLVIMVGSYGFSIFITSGILGNIRGTGPSPGAIEGEGEFGCCLVQIRNDGSDPFSPQQKYWRPELTTEQGCTDFVPASGYEEVARKPWEAGLSERSCQIKGRELPGL